MGWSFRQVLVDDGEHPYWTPVVDALKTYSITCYKKHASAKPNAAKKSAQSSLSWLISLKSITESTDLAGSRQSSITMVG